METFFEDRSYGVMIPCHAADHKVDEAVTSSEVQKKLKTLEAVALHAVISKSERRTTWICEQK